MTPLAYTDLYQLCEELQQLVKTKIQAVYNPNSNRYILSLSNFRNLVIDLTPNRPFIVSISSTKIKTQSKKTPLFNFLRAHFVGLTILAVEIAQKPNRTLKLTFEQTGSLEFKCFPHGQHLLLKANDKVVNYPLRPKDTEVVTYLEPEPIPHWDFNDKIAEAFLSTAQAVPQGAPAYVKVLKKLEKALTGLEEGSKNQEGKDLERIRLLEKEGELAKSDSSQNVEEIYDEIKRLKKKSTITNQRRAEILSQIEKIKSNPDSISEKEMNLPKKKGENAFSGTRVKLSEHWELWVGRTAWQNDDLLRAGGGHELWIHLRDYPGAHGLIRGPKKVEPSLAQIETAARVVAILSQSKKKPFSDGEKLDFIITPKKFVKKRKGDAPGRVIVERETVRRIAFKAIKFEVIY